MSEIADRFWAKVDVGHPLGCWQWTAAMTSHGYGVIGRGGGRAAGNVMAHRTAYELLIGPIPEGLFLDHLCRNPGCVNPDHLEPVTNRENILRGYGWAGQHARKTHCPQGHPYTSENTYMENARGRSPHRRCKACRSEQRRAPARTTCRNGHPLEGNRYIAENGEARCTACQRDKARRVRARKAARV